VVHYFLTAEQQGVPQVVFHVHRVFEQTENDFDLG
jgi:hypothetical protein